MSYQIGNTFFEWELLLQTSLSLEEAFAAHPIFSQLQFLPFLYGNRNDIALLTAPPPSSFLQTLSWIPPRFSFFTDRLDPTIPIESWGHSNLIAQWANEKGLFYSIPAPSLTRHIHSKQFSFTESVPLPGACLIETEEHLFSWIHSFPEKKVLKSCFGTAGRGHFFLDPPFNKNKLRAFAIQEWNNNLPIIGEPWVDRVLDFSTQWKITEKGEVSYLGATVCGNTKRGQYGYSLVGEETFLFGDFLPFLYKHLKIAQPLVQKIASLGWFGHLGIDAFVYQSSEILLHPIVEINARKTMGYAALAIRNMHYPEESIRVLYQPSDHGLLPLCGSKNLQIEVIRKKDLFENRKTCLQLSPFPT